MLHLFRLLCEDRISFFLRDNKLDPVHWRLQIEIYLSIDLSSFMNLSSLRHFSDTTALPVWENVNLFTAFLECTYSPVDWTGLSLDKFLAPNDQLFFWADEPSREGRDRLLRAVLNLQLMMTVHFGSPFRDCFSPLIDFFSSEGNRLGRYHDIYLRSSLESLLAIYFNDIKSYRPVLFPQASYNTPVACAHVLNSHIRYYIETFKDRPIFPHLEWYNPLGGARSITLDPGTFNALTVKKPFEVKFRLRNPVITLVRHSNEYVPKSSQACSLPPS